MKTLIKTTLTKLAFIAAIGSVIPAMAQAPKTSISVTEDKQSTVVFASSLREMYGMSEDGRENNFEMILANYYDIKYAHIAKDPVLKQKLIDEFLEDIKEKGYKVPKKIKSADYFEPYIFILDLPVYLNKAGNIIPADQAGKGLTSFVDK